MRELSFYITLKDDIVIPDKVIVDIQGYLRKLFPSCKSIGHTVKAVPDYEKVLELMRELFGVKE